MEQSTSVDRYACKKKEIDLDIPWYHNISLMKREIIVGKTCLSCDKLIGNELTGMNSHIRVRHKECQRLHRLGLTKDRYWKSRDDPSPKTCVDCGNLIEENKWNRPNVLRCGFCQFKHGRKQALSYKKPREHTVAVECIYCHTIIPTNHANTIKCQKCRNLKIEKGILSNTDKYKASKKYLKTLKRDNPLESLGTYATVGKYRQYPTNHLAKDKDGKPDFKREQQLVSHLKKVTFSSKGNHYHFTEGDSVRGIKYNEIDSN
jgi:hypothetical protein